MNKKQIFFMEKQHDKSIDEFKKQVINDLQQKKWVNEDGGINTELLKQQEN